MKLWHLLFAVGAGVVVVVGCAWAIWVVTLGGVREDVAAIRSAVVELDDADKDALKSAHTTEIDLRKELGDLTAQLKVTTESLSGLNQSVTGLDVSVKAVDDKLTGSIQRQEVFERYVFATLSELARPSVFTKDLIDKYWGDAAAQEKAIETIVAGDDGGNPIFQWQNLVKARQ